jgi:hypothetical protein
VRITSQVPLQPESIGVPRGGDRHLAERFWPYLLVVAAVGFNLWALRAQRLVVSYPNDSQTHLQMVQMAHYYLARGELPFGHWYPDLSLGSPFFVQYQSASAVLTGLLSLPFGATQTYAWSLYLLLALWPLCIYWSCRLLGWGRWEAGIAAAISPLLRSVTGHGFEPGAYTWLGWGLWSELWAMWSLLLAWGFTWRFVSHRRYLFGAVVTLAATIAFHFLMAYLAGAIVIVVVLARPHELLKRLGRGAILAGCAVLATLWVTVPLALDARWTALNEFQVGTSIDNSYGARQILSWLVHGQLYDAGRFPIITILVALGLVVSLVRWRTDERSRVLVLVWTVSMLLYFGRTTFGALFNLLPGSQELLFQRFIAGLSLAGIVLAAVGVVETSRAARDWIRRRVPVLRPSSRRAAWLAAGVTAVAVVALLSPAWMQTWSRDQRNGSYIAYQRAVDNGAGRQVDALLAMANRLGGGRVYAGAPNNWGREFLVGWVPAYIYMEREDVDEVGFTLRTFSLMSDPEVYFESSNPADYDAFAVHYLLLPRGGRPPVAAHLLAVRGRFALWTVGSGGYVQMVNVVGAIAGNASDLGTQMHSFVDSSLPARGIYLSVAFAGQPPAPPTLRPGERIPDTPTGAVLSEHDDLAQGRVTAVVLARRESVALLKCSFDPGWTATVDGVAVKPEMIAPALVGVPVGPGVHRIVYQYNGFSEYPLFFGVAGVTLLAVALGASQWRRLRRRIARTPRRSADGGATLPDAVGKFHPHNDRKP